MIQACFLAIIVYCYSLWNNREKTPPYWEDVYKD